MLRVAFGILGVLASLHSVAQSLSGEWVVDYDLTVGFYERNFRQLGAEGALFKCSARNSRLYFYGDFVRYELRSHMCSYQGKEGGVEGASNSFSYALIGEGSGQLAISLKGESENRIEVINWLDENVFWVDSSSESSLYRYYYRRVN